MSRKLRQQNKRSKEERPETQQNIPLSPELKENLQKIKDDMGNSEDLIIREVEEEHLRLQMAFVYIDGLVDTTSVSEFTIQTVLDETSMLTRSEEEPGIDELIKDFKLRAFSVGEITKSSDWEKIYAQLLSGDTILFLNGSEEVIIAGTRGGEKRSVTEPTSQTVIRGPREGFTESIRTNTSLLRRKIKSPKLWLEEMQIGEVTKTEIGIMYIQGIVSEEIVTEVRKRLSNIHIDGILESGYIEELIEDTNFTVFPTVYHSERPDVIAANLLEGRVAIMVDGTPFALVVPSTFNMFFQSAEDYYNRFDVGSLIRVLRFISFFIGLLLPSLYVAIITFHQEMIPTPWLIKLAVQREGVPFPAFVEAVIMEMVFEILREAGVRMPRTVGNTISIVGGLVLGQAAVEAGIVSPAVVIVVSLTAIASFVSPAYNIGITARILRFLFLFASSFMGIFGMACLLLIMLLHLCSLKSVNVPYMAPYGPSILSDMKDTFIRVPMNLMKTRPKMLSKNNPVRFRKDNDVLHRETMTENTADVSSPKGQPSDSTVEHNKRDSGPSEQPKE
ncbi:spore germination protein KA [Paenibacillus sp. J23TS9]|uniref:spore germination protein n=1 Tax=Paenibacillus sp. J23TS9 TaxID=2807193 RepID=UPI001B0DA9F5|nr:spore germination protein [Paenibacillus sp. J23TS9]GIP27111.1 spore germination protein KA [Paenibacillus sp. J23TS9]